MVSTLTEILNDFYSRSFQTDISKRAISIWPGAYPRGISHDSAVCVCLRALMTFFLTVCLLYNIEEISFIYKEKNAITIEKLNSMIKMWMAFFSGRS